MMEEVGADDPKEVSAVTEQLAQAKLDELHEAQTDANGTKSTPPASTAESAGGASGLPPPSQLPPQLTSPLQPPPPVTGFTPSSAATQGASSAFPASPPRPHIFTPSTTPAHAVTPPHAPGPVPSTFTPGSTVPAVQPQTQRYTPPGVQMYTPPGAQPYAAPGTTQGYQAPQYGSPPGALRSPYEASAAISVPEDYSSPQPAYQHQPTETGDQGMFGGWFSGSGFMHKVMEKTKSSVETMITTLDPGMKQVIYSGGDVSVVVTSTKDVKVEAIRQAFQETFGRATVTGQESQPNIAPQPVGYTAGLKGCEERTEALRQRGGVDERQPIISIENFLVEMLPDRWYDMGCILLKDPANNIELQTFTQATPVSSEFVTQAQDQTPADYNLRWSGLAVTVGQVIQQSMPYVHHADWHKHFTGVSRREMIYLAAKALAGMYKQRLPTQTYSS